MMMVVSPVRSRFGAMVVRVVVSVVVSVHMPAMIDSLVCVWPVLGVANLHAESLGPRLHLDKANFSLTASTDKRK